jgi:hypothetical protein
VVGLSDKFPEQYPITKSAVDLAWKSGFIVPDANILLELYEVSPPARKNLEGVLKKLESRLWFPHQVLTEYLQNRRNVVQKTAKSYTTKIGELKVQRDGLNSLGKEHQSPFLDAAAELKAAAMALEAVIAGLEKARDSLPGIELDPKKDSVLSFVEALAEGRTGDALPHTKYVEAVDRAGIRMKNEIPPGFEDLQKGPSRAAGDFLWWSAVVEKSKADKRPAIIISNDTKSDWIVKENNTVLGVHPLLRREMRDATGYDVVVYDSEEFYEEASKFLKQLADEETLKELEAKRAQEERRRAEALAMFASGQFFKPGTLDAIANFHKLSQLPDYSELLKSASLSSDLLKQSEALSNAMKFASIQPDYLKILASTMKPIDFSAFKPVDLSMFSKMDFSGLDIFKTAHGSREKAAGDEKNKSDDTPKT